MTGIVTTSVSLAGLSGTVTTTDELGFRETVAVV